MILLRKTDYKGNTYPVVLIGRGLIGTSIEQELIRADFLKLLHLKPEWNDEYVISNQLISLIEICTGYNANRVNIIWAAGKAGFEAKNEQTFHELITFQKIVNDLTLINQKKISIKLHLISSAGGLFEGQCNVNSKSKPYPLRPYGFLKLNQEKTLFDLNDVKRRLNYNIYRLSTVYGYAHEGSRIGLISNLVINSLKNRETIIYGHYNTMRDYLWVEDLAKFIANEILSDYQLNKVFTLASCMPLSIFQVHRIVEKITNRKCAIRFISNLTNMKHNTCEKNVTPENFRASLIFSNISKIYFDALKLKIS